MIKIIQEFIKLAQQTEKQPPGILELSQISGINMLLFKANQWPLIKEILNIFNKIIWVKSGHLLYLTDFWTRDIMPGATWKAAGSAAKSIVKDLIVPGSSLDAVRQEQIFNSWMAGIQLIQNNHVSDQDLLKLVGANPKEKLINLINQLKNTL